jgi:hypothetical protein
VKPTMERRESPFEGADRSGGARKRDRNIDPGEFARGFVCKRR